MTTLINCPFCDGARLTEQDEIAEFNDRKNGLQLSYYKLLTKCLDCHERFEAPTQRAENGKRIADARSAARGAPTGAQIRALRKAWGLTIAEAGALFGGGEIAFAKYEKGEIVPVQSMSKLLRLAIQGLIELEALQGLNSVAATNMQAPSSRASLALIKPSKRPEISRVKPLFPITSIDGNENKSFSVVDSTYITLAFSSELPYAKANASGLVAAPHRISNDTLEDNHALTSTFSDLIYDKSRQRRELSMPGGRKK
jgi:putative zinc finger/helix-turn-helix YgiT family protein